jgi:hypothetical protein
VKFYDRKVVQAIHQNCLERLPDQDHALPAQSAPAE